MPVLSSDFIGSPVDVGLAGAAQDKLRDEES